MLISFSLLMVGPWSCECGLKSCSLYKYYRYVDFGSTSVCQTYLLCDIWLNFVCGVTKAFDRTRRWFGQDCIHDLTQSRAATLSICYIISVGEWISQVRCRRWIPKSKLLHRSLNHIERNTSKSKYLRRDMCPASWSESCVAVADRGIAVWE